jgi:hypothetical protein
MQPDDALFVNRRAQSEVVAVAFSNWFLSALPELSFRFDFRFVLVALISPWQVNGQTSGGGFWVALQL